MSPRDAAVRHGSPAPFPSVGEPADSAFNSSTEETTRSATRVGQATGATGLDSDEADPADAAEAAGSSTRMPADIGRGSSNGRFNRCSCAIASFSCSVYAGRSTTCRQSRTFAGIAPTSVAVAIHRTPERSSGTARYASTNAVRFDESRTPSSGWGSSSASPAWSIPSRMKTGLFTLASRRPSTTQPGVRRYDPRICRLVASPSRDTLTGFRPRASAIACASDVLPVPRGPARQRTEARA